MSESQFVVGVPNAITPCPRIRIAERINISLASTGQLWRQSRTIRSRQERHETRAMAPLRQANHPAVPHRMTLPVIQAATSVGALSILRALLNSTTNDNNPPQPAQVKSHEIRQSE